VVKYNQRSGGKEQSHGKLHPTAWVLTHSLTHPPTHLLLHPPCVLHQAWWEAGLQACSIRVCRQQGINVRAAGMKFIVVQHLPLDACKPEPRPAPLMVMEQLVKVGMLTAWSLRHHAWPRVHGGRVAYMHVWCSSEYPSSHMCFYKRATRALWATQNMVPCHAEGGRMLGPGVARVAIVYAGCW
jgi:hypothetical protein